MNSPIYMDYAAATPLDGKVLKAMEPYFAAEFYNPSAGYLAAKEVLLVVENARKTVANWLGARPSEIIFTAGGTEANNLAIQGVMRAHPGKKVLFSAVEHDSALMPAKLFSNQAISVETDGRVKLKSLERSITPDTVLVSVMYANNEIGVVQPLKQVAKIIDRERASRRKTGNKLPIYFHTDACQAAQFLDLHISRLGVDLMTINGGKIYGPKQSGALFIKGGTKLQPLVLGGGQENSRRSGTENVPSIIGFAAALDSAQKNRAAEADRLSKLQQLFIEQINKSLPQAIANGSLKHRLPNNIHITLPGFDNERLMMELDERGIQCGQGSACSASSEEPSHVLMAIGLTPQAARSSLRFTMGRSSNEVAVKTTVKELARLVSK